MRLSPVSILLHLFMLLFFNLLYALYTRNLHFVNLNLFEKKSIFATSVENGLKARESSNASVSTGPSVTLAPEGPRNLRNWRGKK